MLDILSKAKDKLLHWAQPEKSQCLECFFGFGRQHISPLSMSRQSITKWPEPILLQSSEERKSLWQWQASMDLPLGSYDPADGKGVSGRWRCHTEPLTGTYRWITKNILGFCRILLSPSAGNYSPFEKQFLACCWALETECLRFSHQVTMQPEQPIMSWVFSKPSNH